MAPINFGRPLSDSIKESMVPLVDGFGVPLGIRGSGKADGTCVVAGDKGAWVRVAKAGEYVAEVYCLLADSKQHRICDLSSGSYNGGNDSADGDYGTIDSFGVASGAHVENATGSTSRVAS